MKNNNQLLSISPIDGRYNEETKNISEYFSEYAYLKYRTELEIKYFIELSNLNIIRKFKKNEINFLNTIIKNFNLKSAEEIKSIEKITKHDVKAIEYYLREKINKSSLKDLTEFIHFGLTSEDINNIATRLMLRDLNNNILLPSIKDLNKEIFNQSKKYKDLPMIARTHGQAAVPTTLGKELLVFNQRINYEIDILEKIKLKAKINGAVGNYNSLYFSYPKTDWIKFSKSFLKNLNLEINLITTQIAPYEDIIYFFQTIQRINNILLDFNQDMWRYISDNYFIQENSKNEIGSSTMPQKINPIMFENSEGNLIIANSLIEGFTNKLSISRLQRDLSGSTISRNFGVVIAHSTIAYNNSIKGLLRLSPNKTKIDEDLNSDWSILSEAVQIYLKKEGIKNAYELVKELSRGNKFTKNDWVNLIEKLPIKDNQKNKLKNLTPELYIGKLPL